MPVICFAPQFLAEEMLHLEGFSSVEYIELLHTRGTTTLAAGEADLSMEGIESFIPALDAGEPIVGLAGVHAGCLELFANNRVNGALRARPYP